MWAGAMKRRFPFAVLFVILVLGGCRSTIDLSTPRGQTQFGLQAAKMDLWREAQFRFQRAVELNPGNAMAYNNLAVAYEGIGEYEQAREAYLLALNIDRGNEYIQRNYSRFVEFYSKRASEPAPRRVARSEIPEEETPEGGTEEERPEVAGEDEELAAGEESEAETPSEGSVEDQPEALEAGEESDVTAPRDEEGEVEPVEGIEEDSL
jgi:tetratricopeptide (TPR) repeat protein